MADFFERTELLQEMVGNGDLTGEFTVNRVYAGVQHEKGWLSYMGRFGPKDIEVYHGGGGEKFVEDPLERNFPGYYQGLADAVLEGRLVDAMADNLQDQDRQLGRHAPERTGALKKSGGHKVYDDGVVVHEKSPEVPYEDPNPGPPPGFVLGFLKRGYA